MAYGGANLSDTPAGFSDNTFGGFSRLQNIGKRWRSPGQGSSVSMVVLAKSAELKADRQLVDPH